MLIKSSEQWLYFKIRWMHFASTESPFEYPFSNGCFYSSHKTKQCLKHCVICFDGDQEVLIKVEIIVKCLLSVNRSFFFFRMGKYKDNCFALQLICLSCLFRCRIYFLQLNLGSMCKIVGAMYLQTQSEIILNI